MKAGSRFLNAVSAVALSAGVSSVVGMGVLASAGVANAAVINRIDVRGAERAGADSVRSNITIAPGRNFSNADIDESVKRLYATGYFSNVAMSVSGSTLVVTVSENQLVNQVVFNGNRKIKDDKLAGITQTQSLGPYDQTLVTSDISRIKEAYAAIGRSDVRVDDLCVIHFDFAAIDVDFDLVTAEGFHVSIGQTGRKDLAGDHVVGQKCPELFFVFR